MIRTVSETTFNRKSRVFTTISFIITFAAIIVIHCDEVSDLTKLINDEVNAALSYQLPTDNSHLYSETSDPIQDGGTYSFIIIGAGSAGAVLAKRLSDQPFRTVLLLEAGEDQNTFSDIPGPFRSLQHSKYNWGYFTTPQTHTCQGMIKKQCAYPRGQVMGGSSSINGLMYVRSSPYDHEQWTNAGITGWAWHDVIHYYRKLEKYSLIDGIAELGYHGLTGPVNIEKSTPAIPFVVDYFLKANSEFYTTTNNYNGRVKMGAGATLYTKKNGKRVSSNRAYLNNPNENLTILKKAYAYKLVILNGKATGVEFMRNGRKYLAKAKNEVIVSAGVINSPQLLLLSGIGPQEELNKFNIPIVKALPAVGQHMEDHIGFVGLQFESDILLTNSSIPLEEHVKEYLQQGTGRLTESALASVIFYSTDSAPNPDIEFIMLPIGRPLTKPGNVFNLDPVTAQIFTPPAATIDKNFRLLVLLLHPKSRGSVTLKSSNPQDFPNIDPNCLSDDEGDDIRRIYEAIKYVEKMLQSPTMTQINAKLLKQVLPACEGFEYKSKDYWYCTIQYMSHQIFHPTGTCRIGSSEADSVVDSRLRIHGIKGLRVVDASVIPYHLSGHINGPAMMIAEKAADMIYFDNLFGPY